MSRLFVDLSESNEVFDAGAYRAAGHRLVALKVGEGADYPDGRYGERLKHARTNGLRVLHYHFMRPDLHEDPHNEVMFLVSLLHGRLEQTDFVFLDVEKRGQRDWWEVAHYTRQAVHQARELLNHRVGLYSYASFLASCGPALAIRGCPYWVADYATHLWLPAWVRHAWAWQRTDGKAGPAPHETTGVGRSDISLLNRWTAVRIALHRPH